MYESNLNFAQAEIAYRTQQIATARGIRRRRSHRSLVRRGAAAPTTR
jgi:hypothetical protein